MKSSPFIHNRQVINTKLPTAKWKASNPQQVDIFSKRFVISSTLALITAGLLCLVIGNIAPILITVLCVGYTIKPDQLVYYMFLPIYYIRHLNEDRSS